MSPYAVRISCSVVGTVIPIQSKGYGSSFGCLDEAFDFLRLVGDRFTFTSARSGHPPSSFKTFKDSSTFLRDSLSELSCSAFTTLSAGSREEDSRRRSLMPKLSIISGAYDVGNRATAHPDNLSKG